MKSIAITETDQYLFAQGTHYEIYKKMGAHPCKMDGKEGVYFSVYAPNADSVYVVGDFNEWKESVKTRELSSIIHSEKSLK